MGIDAHTLEIRAIDVTASSVGDAPLLSELLGQIPLDNPIASVGSDGAYDAKACHAAIALRPAYTEGVEWLPPQELGGAQDALPKASG